MNNPREYLASLAAKHGVSPVEWMSEQDTAWRQSLAGLGAEWEDITDVEIAPLAGGGWMAHIHFANGMVIGSKPDNPIKAMAEAEKSLAHLAAIIRSPKMDPTDGERVIFVLNNLALSILRQDLLSPVWIRETAEELGATQEYFLDDILVWAEDEFERIIERCAGNLDEANLVDKMRLKVAAKYMIANNRYVHWTGSYQAERIGRLTVDVVGHA